MVFEGYNINYKSKQNIIKLDTAVYLVLLLLDFQRIQSSNSNATKVIRNGGDTKLNR